MVPSTARVVIIGGGIMGCGLAWHLARTGWTDTLLLEKAELTSGSTWHAAGQVTHSTSSHGLGKCAGYGIDLYARVLEAETGQSVTWHGCGSLRLAYAEDEVDWLRQTVSVGRGLGFPMEIVKPQRIRELHPFYKLDGVKAALHTPDDGHVDPAGAALALAKGAQQSGVRIVRRCRATGVTRLSNGEWRVTTEQGDVVCEHLVNAGGTYARQIALGSGYDLPTTSMTHHYLVTEAVPEFRELARELPVVRDDRLVSGYVRMEQDKGLVGIYEKASPNAVWEDHCPWEAENELFEPDYERILPWLQNAMDRMPVLAKRGIARAVHGAISHPPDGNPLIGPAPGLRNYWCCCGVQIGIGWGPGLARELARWMTHGAADIDMRGFDPRRFGAFADRDYQVTKAKEDYRLRHEIPYPHFNRVAGRPVKPSALYADLEAAGAVFEEVYGHERPRWFAPEGVAAKDIYGFRRTRLHEIVGAETRAVRRRAGIMDISAFAKIEVSGADACGFLDRLAACRLPPPGRVALAHFLNDAGRIEVEAAIACLAENRFYLTCAAFFEQRLFDLLTFAVAGESVRIANRSSEWGALALNGPKSRKILRACAAADLSNAGFRWMSAKTIEIDGRQVHALRMSYAGELGWEFHGSREAILDAFRAIRSAGTAHGLVHYGSFAMNAMRMEKGFKGAGELTNEVTMPEADMMRFVRLDKSFRGKAATLRAAREPLRWRCVHLEVGDDGNADGSGGEAVLADGKPVGTASSVAYGHAVGKLLAFAYVKPAFTLPGTELTLLILGQPRPARVLGAPAFDPENRRPRTDDSGETVTCTAA